MHGPVQWIYLACILSCHCLTKMGKFTYPNVCPETFVTLKGYLKHVQDYHGESSVTCNFRSYRKNMLHSKASEIMFSPVTVGMHAWAFTLLKWEDFIVTPQDTIREEGQIVIWFLYQSWNSNTSTLKMIIIMPTAHCWEPRKELVLNLFNPSKLLNNIDIACGHTSFIMLNYQLNEIITEYLGKDCKYSAQFIILWILVKSFVKAKKTRLHQDKAREWVEETRSYKSIKNIWKNPVHILDNQVRLSSKFKQ